MSEQVGRVEINYTPDAYDDGRKTHTVTVEVDGVPITDADGPSYEWALLKVIEHLALALEANDE